MKISNKICLFLQNNGMDSNIKNSLAQTLVNIAIPGVPIVMQGEELGNKNAEYSWKYDGEVSYLYDAQMSI